MLNIVTQRIANQTNEIPLHTTRVARIKEADNKY